MAGQLNDLRMNGAACSQCAGRQGHGSQLSGILAVSGRPADSFLSYGVLGARPMIRSPTPPFNCPVMPQKSHWAQPDARGVSHSEPGIPILEEILASAGVHLQFAFSPSPTSSVLAASWLGRFPCDPPSASVLPRCTRQLAWCGVVFSIPPTERKPAFVRRPRQGVAHARGGRA